MRKKRRRNMPRSFSNKVGNMVDGFINIFSPRAAYMRKSYRYAQDVMFSSHKGASTSRLYEHWMGTEYSADSDLIPELDRLRERSRDLIMNDSIGSAVFQSMWVGDVGSGIRPQSRLQSRFIGINDEQISQIQHEQEHAWEKWVPYADASEHSNYYELQQLADKMWVMNGEALFLVRKYSDGRGPYPLYLQPIESDRLSTPNDYLRDKNRNIHGGVEIGERNQPIKFWIRKSHPGNTGAFYNPNSQDYMAIDPYDEFGNPNIIHIFTIDRAGQSRGKPFLSPILALVKNYGEWREADIVAKRIRACFGILISTPDPYTAAEGAYDETNSDGQRLEELEPGLIKYLGPGEQPYTLDPDKHADKTKEVMDGMLREACGALGVPFEVIEKDFSGTTYTSGRMALLEAWRYFKVRQAILDTHLNIPVWSMVQEQAYLAGDVSVPDFYKKRHEYTRSEWIPQGRQWVDPLKESKAAEVAIKNDIDTIDNISKAQGRNWEDQLIQRGRERKMQASQNPAQKKGDTVNAIAE